MLGMKSSFCKFKLPGELVPDCCADMISLARACILIPQYRRFVLCDVNLESIDSSPPQLALIFKRQESNKELDIIGDDDLQKASSIFFHAEE